MAKRKRSIATRRKKEMILQKKDECCQMSEEMEIVIGMVILISAFLKGVFIGYIIRKYRVTERDYN